MRATPASPGTASRSFVRYLVPVLLAASALAALYFAVVLNWSYSSGERAGWVQKFSKKGWICKTWEGEITLVSMPGAIPEKFPFTVTDDAVAMQINRHMGRRVSLRYEQKVGLPTTCFGETRYYVVGVAPVEEVPLVPGAVVPAPRTGEPGVSPASPAVPQGAPAGPAARGGGEASGAPRLPSAPGPIPALPEPQSPASPPAAPQSSAVPLPPVAPLSPTAPSPVPTAPARP